MGLFDKFFGILSPETSTPLIAGLYAAIGFVFMILSFGRWIMPHAETDLAIPWAVVCILLLITGAYGVWATTKGSTWHHRQYVSASWGFLLMFLCWGIVYIAVEENHVEKVNGGCVERTSWTWAKCDEHRRSASLIAIIMVSIGMILGTYLTVVTNRWVSSLEWAEQIEKEKRLAAWRDGKGENPNAEKMA
ncbi:hypothetical protein BGZ76_003277 [Entomortierella beljakovae]|nr:hypothetical protein BGZ76_003277 [Entomortierella beljakovae]